MAEKNPSQLTSITSPVDTDLVLVYDTGASLLKKMTWLAFIGKMTDAIAGTYLRVTNNLSDLASASSARANLGLGTVATLASSALFQVANNFSEVANAATARANLGAAASNAPTITGGMTFSGSTKSNVQAVSALDIDWSVQEFQTKSISTNSTFTFSGFTASKAQAVLLLLTISGGAAPTWPASVDWSFGQAPTLGNGTHLIGLVTFDGGTTVIGTVGAVALA